MLFKIIIFTTISVVACIKSVDKISNVLSCHTDRNFLRIARKYTTGNIPILVTESQFDSKNNEIISKLNQLGYKTIIKVYASVQTCPATLQYFNAGNDYPVLYMMINNVLSTEKLHNHSTLSVEQFCQKALAAPQKITNSTVTLDVAQISKDIRLEAIHEVENEGEDQDREDLKKTKDLSRSTSMTPSPVST